MAKSKRAFNRAYTPPPTRLKAAIRQHDMARLEALLALGADPNGCDNKGRPHLFNAIRLGHADMAFRLIERGADIHARDKSGKSALDCAKAGTAPDITGELHDLLSRLVTDKKQQRLRALAPRAKINF